MSHILLDLCLFFPLIAFLVILIFSILSGLKRTVPHAIARIVCCIGAGAIAFWQTPLLREWIVPRLWGITVRYISPNVREWAASLPNGAEGLKLLLGLMAAPLLFGIIFWASYAVIRIICALVLRIFGLKPHRIEVSLPGTLLGAVHGILLATVLVMPLCGYMSVASDTILAFSDTGAPAVVESQENDFDMHHLQEFADEVADDFFLRTVRATGGRMLFAPLTTGQCAIDDGVYTLKLETELPQIASAVGTTLCMTDHVPEMKDAELLAEADRALLTRTKDALMASDLIKLITADLVSRVSSAWSQDQPILGMEPPQVNPVLVPTMLTVYRTLSDEKPSYLDSDLETCLNIYCQLSDAGILQKELNASDLMTRLGSLENGGLLRSVQKALRENPHLSALSEEIDALGMRAVAKVLEESGLADGQYDVELSQISGILNEVRHMAPDERAAILQVRVREAMQGQDVDIPDEVAVAMCEKILTDMDADGLGDMDGEQLRNYLMEHASDLASELPEGTLPQ